MTTDAEYFRDVWYSLMFDVDVDSELYRFYYGEKGAGELTEVTTGWTPWITQQNTDPETLGGMLVATSGTGTQSGELYLDNVACTPEPGSILALLSLVGLIPALRRRK